MLQRTPGGRNPFGGGGDDKPARWKGIVIFLVLVLLGCVLSYVVLDLGVSAP